ncbi:RNA polymerase II nuclear localization protein IWR1 [Hypsizygus marmoreus]|uniref:Probable RNA polymerase II nuclear localization protein SLC7A6OS n=1 Tax=Hypsizygus marmoreus TaxID=39966 RepID=A0A369J9L6_HYPMA|nr:RNA polymerase II nuclear localization protein IWR1 [Hypsizygus marmoreus]
MEIDPAPQSYTILRIKRKRNEEPLDALVVESRVRRKKSRGGIGMFQFAKTVENDVWQDEKQAKDIQEQVSRLARESSAASTPEARRTSSPAISRQKEDARRYTILQSEEHDLETPKVQRAPTSPPKVISAKDLPPKTLSPDVKMYDAVLAADKASAPAIDPEMEKFLPMLNDYLKLHDVAMEPPDKGVAGGGALSSSKSDDYVWDVFYHRPATLSEWNDAANVGTLSGLPPSITDPYDSASESEEEDEADEDSNAEEYYKNDYPEEVEEDDSLSGDDEFHEREDYEDMRDYFEEGEDHDWR